MQRFEKHFTNVYVIYMVYDWSIASRLFFIHIQKPRSSQLFDFLLGLLPKYC